MTKYDDLLAQNKYDDLLTADRARRNAVVRGVIDRDPDQSAQVIGLSRETGIPSQVVERNRDLVAQEVERNRYDRMLEQSPILSEFLSEQENASVARDDIANLSGFEWAWKAFSKSHSQMWGSIELSQLRVRQLNGEELSPEQEERIKQLKVETTPTDLGAENWFEKMIVETGRILPTMEFIAREGLEQGVVVGAGFAGIAAAAGQAGPQIATPEEIITVPAAGLMGLGFGTATGGAQAAYELEAGLAYDEYLDIGIDDDLARAAAGMVGLVNAGLESFGISTAVKYIPGINRIRSTLGRTAVREALKQATFRQALLSFAGRYAQVMGTEITTEVLQEATTILGGEIAGRMSEGEFQGLTGPQISERLAQIAVSTAQGMTVLGGIGPGASFVRDASRAHQAQQNQRVFQALADNAQGSKLRERMPEKFQEYVRRLGGPIDTIRIPVERFEEYFQSQNLDPAEIASTVTGSDTAYTQAQAAGTDIEISVDAYATHLAPTEHHQGLAQDLRLKPDEMTLREAQEWQSRADELTQELAAAAPTEATRPVYDDVLGQLLQSGMEQGAAEQNATLMASVFETLGQRTGVDPMGLYQQYGLRVQREMPDVLQGTTFDQLAPDQLSVEEADGNFKISGVDGGRRVAFMELKPSGESLQVRVADVVRERRGEQIGQQLIVKAYEVAAAQGRALVSDVSVSVGQLRAYDALRRRGWTIEYADPEVVAEAIKSGNPNNVDDDVFLGGTMPIVTKIQPPSDTLSGMTSERGPGEQLTEELPREPEGDPVKKSVLTDPNALTFQEEDQNRLAQMRELFPEGEGYYPVVVILEPDGSQAIVDGHNRAQIAIERGDQLPVVSITREAYDQLSSSGFDDIEIAYAALDYAGENEAASALNRQFPGADVVGRGIEAGIQLSSFEQPGARSGAPTVLEQRFDETRRGSIQFGAARQFNINLLKDADLSTFLHESGHFYLEVIGDLAEARDAPQQIVQDYAAILKWMGVESRQAIGVDQHEQFARGFEAWLMEGKAPSIELQNAFARFKAWLVQLYRRLTALNVSLSKEVRDVFSRLAATDEAIARAESTQAYAPLFLTAETAGMSPKQFEAYKNTVTQARLEAEESLGRKLLDVMTREQRKWWKAEREKVHAGVSTEVHAMRVYRTLSFLQAGKNPDGTPAEVAPVKLSKAILLKQYPQSFLNRLPGAGRTTVYSVQGGEHPDVVANLFGYRGVDEMIQDLVNARPMKALIEAETNARMHERYPDSLTDGSLTEKAFTAVHNDKRAELLSAELRALRRKQREVSPFVRGALEADRQQRREALEANRGQLPDRDELALIRQAAQRVIGQRQVFKISPHTYRVAEAKAARAAFEAAGKGRYDVAYLEKRKELLNHEFFRAAEAARNDAEKIREYFKKFGKRSIRERLGKAGEGSLEKIDTILAEFSLSRVSGTAIEQAERKRVILAQIEAGELVAEPETLAQLNREALKNWRELSYDQLVGVRDIIKQLEHQAREVSEAVVNGEKVKIQESAEQVAGSILAGGKPIAITVGTRGPMDVAKRRAKEALLVWLRPSEIARQLDGGQDFGPVTRTIIEPIRRAYAEKLIPKQRKAQNDVAELYRKAYTDDELVGLSKREHVAELGLSMTRGDLLSLALNWGNEGNRQAVLEGTFDGRQIFSEPGVKAALTRLTAKDWAFVQSVWDYIDTYWGELAAAEKRRRGIAPKKVEAASFQVTTADGPITVRGGYYPLKYDSELSSAQRGDNMEDEYKKFVQGRHVTATTRAGATHERVGSGKRPVRLGLGVIDEHLHEVSRDIALGDEVRFVMRVLRRPEVKEAAAKTGNANALDTLNLWLQDSAVGEIPARGVINRSAAWIRTGFTTAKIGWNMVTTVLQITGLPQSMVVVGTKALAHGSGKFASSPVAMHKHIMEQSAFMRARYQENSWNKDVQDTRAYLHAYFGGVPTKVSRVTQKLSFSFFWPIARMQMVVDEITWLAGYWKGVNEKSLSDSDAAVYADSVVENAQTSGFFSDRSGIERGTLDATTARQAQYVKLWTTLISYMLAKSNIAYAKGRAFVRNPTLWGATTLAGDLVVLFTIEAVLAAMIRGQLPDDEDDESLAWWLLKETGASALSGVPFVREIHSARFGGGNTPIGGLATDFYKALEQTQQGEVDPAMIKAWNNVGGTLFHYPSSQINRAVDAYWADAEGEDVEFYEYVTGVRD